MNIVFVGPFGFRPKATMASRALPLAKALAARGYRLELLLPPWNCPEDSGRAWHEDGVHIHHIILPPARPLLQHIQITARLLQRVRRLSPDVVHCFKPKAYSGLLAWAVWWLRRAGWLRARLVMDSDDWEGPGGWNEIERYSAAQQWFFAWQERWGLRHADAVTVASKALQTIVWSLGAAPNNVYYVPNGVSEEQAHRPGDGVRVRREHGLGDDPVLLLYTRFFEFGVERAVEILERVVAQIPTARLLLVGEGLFGEEKEMLRLLQERKLAAHAVYAGWVDPALLPDYFAAADVALYPFDDTLINRTKCAAKLLELLAAGLPVVADDVGQNGEYIQHEETGLLVPPGQTELFAASLIRLLRDKPLRTELGEQARAYLLANYGWNKLAETVERAYAGLLAAAS